MSETDDDKFIAWAQKKVGIYLTDKDEDRLFALARRGAAVQWKPCCVCGAMQHWMPLPPPPSGETSDE